MQKTIDAAAGDEGSDGTFLIASSRRQKHDFRKLGQQLLEQRSCASLQHAQIGDEDAAMTADQQLDGCIRGGRVPDFVGGRSCFAQRTQQRVVLTEDDDVYSFSATGAGRIERVDTCIGLPALHCIDA